MYDETDTATLERDQFIAPKKKPRINGMPSWIALGVICTLALVMAAIIVKERRDARRGVMEIAYPGPSSARELVGDASVPVKAPEKRNHVIFRLGDEEVFRFTYEDSGDGRRCSFEIREGGS